MPFHAQVVRVLIASPGDTPNSRRVVREALEDWNSLHAERDGVMVLPVMWERDATPEMGDRPQGIINRQLVDVADVLVGIFWTRMGTATSEAESGTAEEIDRFIEAGKPVLLYFSSEPVAPDSVDADQYARLVSFRKGLEAQGLIDFFASAEELRLKVTAALTRTIRDRFAASVADVMPDDESHSSSGAVLLARIDRQRELSGFSSGGRPRYTSRDRLVIENQGTAPAENLSFHFDAGDPADRRLPTVLAQEGPISRLPPRGAIDFPMSRTMGTVSQWDIVFRWTEGETEREARQTLR